MGFFDLFKKKKQEEVKEIEKIAFADLSSWIKNKNDLLKSSNEKYLESIGNRKKQLISDIDNGVVGLNSINWDKIRTEDRVKKIVKENLVNYVGHLESLNSELGKLSGERKEIEKKFKEFDKRAGMSYQKATFLIGKEMGVIDESVGNFFRDLKKIEEDNKDLVSEIGKINSVREKLSRIKEIDDKNLQINKLIKDIGNNRDLVNNEIKKLDGEIEGVKKSDDYRKFEDGKRMLENSRGRFGVMIKGLRGMIDFKKLAKDWHKNEKEMKIIKKYRENFDDAFGKDNGVVLKVVISSLDNRDLVNLKLAEVLELKGEIEKIELGSDLTLEFQEKIGKLRNEIQVLEMDKTREEKRIEKFDIEKVRVVGEVKKDLMGVVDVGD